MDLILKFCSSIFILITFSVLKCQAYYCSYYDQYYYYYTYCPDYSSYSVSAGAIAGIVIGCLFALGFGIFILALCCGAVGAACKSQPARVSTIAAAPSTNVMTSHYYHQPQAYGYGPQPMAPPPYGYNNSAYQPPIMQNHPQQPPQYQQNRTENQSNDYPPLPPQNPPQGHSSNPYAISSDVDTQNV